jgi:hypothetical protein
MILKHSSSIPDRTRVHLNNDLKKTKLQKAINASPTIIIIFHFPINILFQETGLVLLKIITIKAIIIILETTTIIIHKTTIPLRLIKTLSLLHPLLFTALTADSLRFLHHLPWKIHLIQYLLAHLMLEAYTMHPNLTFFCMISLMSLSLLLPYKKPESVKDTLNNY